MESKIETELEIRYGQLLTTIKEASDVIEKINSLLPEPERLSADRAAPIDELVNKIRGKIVKAVLEPERTENVDIDTKTICAELDKTNHAFFSVGITKMIYKDIYSTAKGTLEQAMFTEADKLMPWTFESPDVMIKGKTLLLRHQVRESSYGGSPDGIWQFERSVQNFEKLIKICINNDDPRTVLGTGIRDVYHINRENPWDKFKIGDDPVIISSKLFKNGKLELELASGDVARKVATYLFRLHEERRSKQGW